MVKFKINNWVLLKDSSMRTPMFIKEINVQSLEYNLDRYGWVHESRLELWEPYDGDWCWFYDLPELHNNTLMHDLPRFLIFHRRDEDKYCTLNYLEGDSFDCCIPFTGVNPNPYIRNNTNYKKIITD